jgi:hypothetical protein
MSSVKRPLSENSDASNKKKKVQAPAQSNTLFSYLQFSGFQKKTAATDPKPVSIQPSILGFFKSAGSQKSGSSSSEIATEKSTIKVEQTKTEPTIEYLIEDDEDRILSTLDLDKIEPNSSVKIEKADTDEIIDKHEEKFDESETNRTATSNRKCPFYKIVDGNLYQRFNVNF